MKFKVLGWLFLVAVLILQTGCATERKTYDDSDLNAATPSQEDDSHGWGAAVQAGH